MIDRLNHVYEYDDIVCVEMDGSYHAATARYRYGGMDACMYGHTD